MFKRPRNPLLTRTPTRTPLGGTEPSTLTIWLLAAASFLLAWVLLVVLLGWPSNATAAPAQRAQGGAAAVAPAISASAATASETLKAIREETRLLNAQIREIRASQALDKAIEQRDKARAALEALRRGEGTK